MSNRIVMRPVAAAHPDAADRVRVIKPGQLDGRTPQSDGMRRKAAVSHTLVGSDALWAGVMVADPGTASSVHHHGAQETVVYVLSGPSRVRWGSRLEHEVDLAPGDFVFIPPYMPHQEINPSSDEPARWVGRGAERWGGCRCQPDGNADRGIRRGRGTPGRLRRVIMSKLTNFRVAVLATDGFEESELTEPVQALRDAGALVTILSLMPGRIQGVRHDLDKTVTVPVDRTIRDASPREFDAVHLPGGTVNADAMRMASEVQVFLRAMQDAGKPIAAICHAPWELVSAGLVRGRTLTSYHTIQDDIRNAGGNWVDREVVEDGNWVTSRQPADIPAFNRAIIGLFSRGLVQGR